MTINELSAQIAKKKSYLCVGLDSDIRKMPEGIPNTEQGVLIFNKAIIEATLESSVAYKINTAFYEQMGSKGWAILEKTLELIPRTHFIIADAKRGDIGNTAAMYARTFFETMDFDAVTIAPYMGRDSAEPFLAYKNKTTIMLGLTSNPSATDFEMLELKNERPLYEEIIRQASTWAEADRLMFVVGATRPSFLKAIREIIPTHFLLVPGIGAQGGDLKAVTQAALTQNCGLLVNASRSILYAGKGNNFAALAGQAAYSLHKEMASLLTGEA